MVQNETRDLTPEVFQLLLVQLQDLREAANSAKSSWRLTLVALMGISCYAVLTDRKDLALVSTFIGVIWFTAYFAQFHVIFLERRVRGFHESILEQLKEDRQDQFVSSTYDYGLREWASPLSRMVFSFEFLIFPTVATVAVLALYFFS